MEILLMMIGLPVAVFLCIATVCFGLWANCRSRIGRQETIQQRVLEYTA